MQKAKCKDQKDRKIKIELNKKQLQELLEMVFLYEAMRGEMEEDGNSTITPLLKSYSSDQTRKNAMKKADALLDEYLEWTNLQEIDDLLDEQKETMLKIMEEFQRKGASFKSDDLISQLNEKLGKIKLLRLPLKSQIQDD